MVSKEPDLENRIRILDNELNETARSIKISVAMPAALAFIGGFTLEILNVPHPFYKNITTSLAFSLPSVLYTSRFAYKEEELDSLKGKDAYNSNSPLYRLIKKAPKKVQEGIHTGLAGTSAVVGDTGVNLMSLYAGVGIAKALKIMLGYK